MRVDRWENSLEELCDSPEQLESLKETASLFAHLGKPRCSSSFRRELRQELLIRACGQGNKTRKRHGLFAVLAEKLCAGRLWRCPYPQAVAAAALILALALGLFGDPALSPGGPAGADGREGILLGDAGEPFAESSDLPLPETPVAALEERDAEHGVAGAEFRQEEVTMVEEGTEQPSAATGTGEESPIPGVRPAPAPDKPVSTPEKPDVTPSLPDVPVFAVDQNRRSFTVAGNVLLNYGPATGTLYPVDGVKFSWEPNKIVPASAPVAQHFGTPQWARQLLSDEGFRVREGEVVEVKTQETARGLYAEIFYRVSPAIILHVHEKQGILAYYYEEKSNLAPQGYYPLLTPLDALQQLQAVKSPIAGQQLHFSFREVRLTYHDFLVEKDGVKNSLRLPAWGFTGNELHQGKEGVNFFLPAVQ